MSSTTPLIAIRSHIGRVTVLGPAGAAVSVNGKPAGRLPLSEAVRVVEGNVRVEATAQGRRPAEVRVDVAGGSAVTVTLELRPLPPPPLVAVPAPRAGIPVDTDIAPRSRWRTWTGASLLALSAGMLATGIVWLVVDGDPTCTAHSGAVCLRVYDTKTQGWIALAASAAAATGGGILVWKDRDRWANVGVSPAVFMAAIQF